MNLKKYRLEIEMTQERLSECTGLSIRHIQDIEAGRVDPHHIKADTAIRLAHVFNISVEELLGAICMDDGRILYEDDFEWFTPTK